MSVDSFITNAQLHMADQMRHLARCHQMATAIKETKPSTQTNTIREVLDKIDPTGAWMDKLVEHMREVSRLIVERQQPSKEYVQTLREIYRSGVDRFFLVRNIGIPGQEPFSLDALVRLFASRSVDSRDFQSLINRKWPLHEVLIMGIAALFPDAPLNQPAPPSSNTNRYNEGRTQTTGGRSDVTPFALRKQSEAPRAPTKRRFNGDDRVHPNAARRLVAERREVSSRGNNVSSIRVNVPVGREEGEEGEAVEVDKKNTSTDELDDTDYIGQELNFGE